MAKAICVDCGTKMFKFKTIWVCEYCDLTPDEHVTTDLIDSEVF